MQKQLIKKAATLVALTGILAFFGIAFFQLQLAFGWTNPLQAPPGGGGALFYSNGNLGVNTNQPTDTLTVNGPLSVMGNLIKGVATPVAGTDAVNKDYVLAQVGGAGGDSFVIYGTATRPGNNPTIPGGAVPACPAGYKDLLFSPDYSSGYNTPGPVRAGGYGPHGVFWNWGFNRDRDSDGSADYYLGLMDPQEQTQVGAVTATYSLCSSEPIHYIPGATFGGGKLPGSPPSFIAPGACTSDGQGNTVCNTCRICGK